MKEYEYTIKGIVLIDESKLTAGTNEAGELVCFLDSRGVELRVSAEIRECLADVTGEDDRIVRALEDEDRLGIELLSFDVDLKERT